MTSLFTILLIDRFTEHRADKGSGFARDEETVYRSIECESYEEVITQCQDDIPKAIVLNDCQLDDDEIDELRQLRQLLQPTPVPVVVLAEDSPAVQAVLRLQHHGEEEHLAFQQSDDPFPSDANSDLDRYRTPNPQHLAAEIALRIYQSSNLEDLLKTAVREIQQHLEVDRAVAIRLDADGTEQVVAESRLTDDDRNDVGAEILLPLWRGTSTANPRVRWGSIAVQHFQSRQWQGWERQTLDELAAHLSIALDRAEEYRDLERQNAHLNAALHQSERRYRNVLDSFPEDLVLLFDRDLRYQTVGGRDVTIGERSVRDLEGRTIWEALSPDACIALEPLYQQALDGETVSDEMSCFDRTYSIFVTPVRDEDGTIETGLALMREMTDCNIAGRSHPESQTVLRVVLETIPQAVFWKDRNGRFLGCNRQLALAAGFQTPDDLIGQTDFNCCWRDEAPLYRAEDLEIMASGRPQLGIETVIALPDLGLRWVRINKVPLLAKNGEALGVLGTLEDITARKLAERELQTLYNTLEARVERCVVQRQAEIAERIQLFDVLEACFNEIYLFDAQTFQFQYVNRDVCQNLGYSREQMAQMTVFDLNPHFSRSQFQTLIAPLIENRIPKLTFEAVYQRADGSQYPVEVRLQLVRQPEKSLFLAVVLDLSDRKATENALRQSQARYAMATRAARVGIWEWNVQTGEFYLDPNLKALLGYDDSEIANDLETWVQYVYEEDREAVIAAAQDCLTGRTDRYVFEHRMVHKDGSLRWIHVRGRVLHDEDGRALRMVGTDTEITDRKRAEMALQASQGQLQRIAANAPGAIFQFACYPDGAQRFTYFSNRSRDLLELEPEAICRDARTLLDLIHPDDFATLETSIETSAREGTRWHWEGRFLTPSGRLRWMQGMSEPERQADGSILWDGLLFDVTERKQAAAELLQNRDLREAIFNESADALFLVDPDSLLTVDCNRRAVELFEARSKSGLVGMEWQMLQRHQFTPSQLQSIVDELETQGYWSSELQYVTKNDRIFWGHLAAKPIEVAGYRLNLVRVTDISALKTVEEQLRKSEAHLLAAQRIARLGSWEYNVTTNAITWSAEVFRIFGRDPHASTPTLEELLQDTDPDDRNRLVTEFERAVAERQAFEIEGRFRREDGSSGHLSARGEPLFSPDGEFLGFLGTALDITERKQFEEALQRTNAELADATRLKDEFLSSMSHELRTPLNAILGIAEGLREAVYGDLDDRVQSALAIVERSGWQLLALIDDILNLSKIEAGRLELEVTPLSIVYLCESSLSFVRQMATQKDIHLECQVNEDIDRIDVDERQMRQILVNLLSNAVKFTPEGGTVGLTVWLETRSAPRRDAEHPEFVERPYIAFAVRDSGIGIAPEDRRKLFAPFVQLDSRLSRQYAGTGLGLSLVKRLAELHGGWVEVDSQSGQGSCFTVWIPARMSALTPETTSIDRRQIERDEIDRPRPRSIPSPDSPLILIAENHDATRKMLASFLNTRGYRTISAVTGSEAARQAQAQCPDSILIDVQMPGDDGLEAIARLRTEMDCMAVPIVALTVSAKEGDRCRAVGADATLTKPVCLQALVQTIERLLAAHPRTKVRDDLPHND
ncbi:MAG: PAS domain S-box protein [Cyanobacteria bacterium SID2]|nr:PAS domain S-box protein [Cyanobacteria bacterium SID2]MBP0004881.1 PAS domain S-box protein [Cyanobacteria bacterium SBC]